ncbi:MAG: peptide chain release factor 1 [Clostridia bacterium]|nr:peptide chain release factor 1 [Clostridia bacterium]MBQ8772274.1 peptide chain release factor 1 [Clostridia bacterium]MBQ8873205.1 peptide chain release factor 1 [Clostridia bacterium]MBQ9706401.1 peptide chain release factor 1 [Clostridia bacterium]
MMTDKLDKIVLRYEFLTGEISKPEVIADNNTWKKLVKEHSNLTPIIEAYTLYKKTNEELQANLEMSAIETDKEMLALLHEDINYQKKQLEELTEQLKVLLLPKDPNDDKNVIIEIRAGAGGEEAALFANEVRRMYYMFAEKNRWKIEEIGIDENELGGLKEGSFMVVGEGAYSKFKFESGVHRVQRVPDTESQGRIHTSTITVAVLPEAPDVDIEILDKDIKIDTYRSSGAGGQHVNKTESAIRITHLPTGIVVNCQDERSQIKNREKAMNILKSKLYDYYQTQADAEYAAARKSQVGTGDRSERIRTYNFPQGRVTDHRIGLTLYSIENFMNGDIAEMVEALRLAEQTAKLQDSDE